MAPREPNEDPIDDEEIIGGEGTEEGEDDQALEATDAAGDAGAEDADGEEDEAAEGSVDDPPRRPNRAQSRIQTLAREAKEAKAEAARVSREMQELRAEQRANAQRAQQESPEARAQRRALMAPDEVMREDLRESEARMQGLLQRQMVEQREREDRANYREILRDNPKLAKFDAEVERVRKDQEANGSFVSREVALKFVIGEASLKAAKSGPTRQVRSAAQRVAQQRTEPSNNRGDAASQRGRQGKTAEDRLKDVYI